MREAFRDPEMPSVFGRQQDGFPLAEGRRTAADVDGDVPDLAIEHGHVLALRLRPLVVQAAQQDRKSVVSGKSVSVRVDLGGRLIIKKKHSNFLTTILFLY